MTDSFVKFRVGSRSSNLALLQTQEAMSFLQKYLPSLSWEVTTYSTPGDRDKVTDLRFSGPDFFTRDLHEAIVNREIYCAIHSAKDLELSVPAGIDWFWLPEHLDQRDVLVLREGESLDKLSSDAIVGVSSVRREEYCKHFLPQLKTRSIRGTIEERLSKLDSAEIDVLICAGCALQRLGLTHRISKWISLTELPTPEGQGFLALTFRSGDERFYRIRSLFIKPVIFTGAGCGSDETWTVGTIHALRQCNVCLYDDLINPEILRYVSPDGVCINVGKRADNHSIGQEQINMLITKFARQTKRVVRLKGGDPGIFSRLSEEIESLDALRLPYRVLPCVSSINVATTGSGMLLTRRDISHGFTVITPRRANGTIGSVKSDVRSALPIVFLMSISCIHDVVNQLLSEAFPETTPAAAVFDAGSPYEVIVRGQLGNIASKVMPQKRPGIFIVGEPAGTLYSHKWKALQGKRVLLAASEFLVKKTVDIVHDYGGCPIPFPLFSLVPVDNYEDILKEISTFDYVVISSPSIAELFIKLLYRHEIDVRNIPKIIVSGNSTADTLKKYGITANVVPKDKIGIDGIMQTIRMELPKECSILRLRTKEAGDYLAKELKKDGFYVRDCIFCYHEQMEKISELPPFDAVFFASSSGVETFIQLYGSKILSNKYVVTIGKPTSKSLYKHGILGVLISDLPDVEISIRTLASKIVEEEVIRIHEDISRYSS